MFIKKSLSEEEIIERISGVDKSETLKGEKGGSCASLAFAYIAQKMGYDVLDFRGGDSMHFFAIPVHIQCVLQYLELQGKKGENGWQNMNSGHSLEKTIVSRFKVNDSISVDPEMYDFSEIKNPDDLKELMCYINTKENEQQKGE